MRHEIPIHHWLPITRKELEKHGWDSVDIVLVSGDCYVDHPSFGTAVVGRVLQKEGFSVAIIPQPNWKDDLRDFRKFGKPNLFFGVSAGNMDSMVNHYTAGKRLRSDDAYTPGGKAGFRPDYAAYVYTKILKEIYPDTPVVLGGIEASMRRLGHYDYWSDSLKKSILMETEADLLIYGMAEQAIIDIAKYYQAGGKKEDLNQIKQIAFKDDNPEINQAKDIIIDFKEASKDRTVFASNFLKIEKQSNSLKPKRIIEKYGNEIVVVNPPFDVPDTKSQDAIYNLPFTRYPHPKYNKRGDIPAFEMIRNSVNIHRGCFGGCSFCAINMHQGKFISSRSEESVLKEVNAIASDPEFKGTITDLGGPSANMYKMAGIDKAQCEKCHRPSCIFPSICKNLNFDHKPLVDLYRRASDVKRIKHIFIGSGVRYDMLMHPNREIVKKYALNEYSKELITKHVSGRLKVAPEHTNDQVLKLIRKPSFDKYLEFRKKFYEISRAGGKNQQIIPYLISSLPGCSLEAMADLAADVASTNYRPEQVQDFTPTPMTLSSVMYYAGIDPVSKEKLFVPKTKSEKTEQRDFFFWYKKENKARIIGKLKRMNRSDLIRKLYR